MGLGLSDAIDSAATDDFLSREGYEKNRRRYRRVVRCWCGSSDLTPAADPRPQFGDYQVCESCGCLLLKVVLSEEHLQEIYGIRFFREVQAAIGLPPFYERYENDAHDRIPIWVGVLRDHLAAGRVLEIGCAHGRFLKELSLLGYRVLGLELDAEISEWARQKTGVDIRSARLETLPDRDFDAVFANDVLEHLYDPKEFVASAIRVMQAGGKALFQTVVFENWQDCSTDFLRPVYHTILYSHRSLPLLAPPEAELLAPMIGVFGCHFVRFLRSKANMAGNAGR